MGQPYKNEKVSWTISSLASYVSEIVAKESGNILEEGQQDMVMSRIKKRLITLGDMTPGEYVNYLKANYQRESLQLVSLLTTHHTFFFREFCHFEYILKNLNNIIENVKERGETKIRILSAACSRGQEVYSLAMFFNLHLKDYPGMSFEIVGADIDPKSVEIAKNGVFPYNEVKSIPRNYLAGNWQRGTGDISQFARVKNQLRDYCSFKEMNLLDLKKSIAGEKFDIIFCRNVFIYLKHEQVKAIVDSFKNFLYPKALFITGVSESLKSIETSLQTFAPSVYCFDPVERIDRKENIVEVVERKEPIKVIPDKIKVLAVDDSSSILKLLEKIFSVDSAFELVGTAKNGIEAEEFLKHNKVDAMTLDIHMPEMDGVEYLKKNYKKGHPHVVVVSSASREDSRYAQETLNNGASDFVEKPSLNNLGQRAEEIKNKIKMAFLNKTETLPTKLDASFSQSFEIKNASDKARVFIANYSDKEKIRRSITDLKGEQPPVFIFFEGNSNFLGMLKDEFSLNRDSFVFQEETQPRAGCVYFCDFSNHFNLVMKKFEKGKTSLSVFGIVSSEVERSLLDVECGQILIEDTKDINTSIKEVVSDIFPWTSFHHVGTEFLARDD